jgi:hypothetical protein
MQYEALFVRALILTVLIECGTAAALKRAAAGRLGLTQTYPRLLAVVVLATCLTLPYVWFVLPAFLPKGPVYAVTAELFAFIVEALWYRLALAGKGNKVNIRQAMILSAITNVFSFLLGFIIMPT